MKQFEVREQIESAWGARDVRVKRGGDRRWHAQGRVGELGLVSARARQLRALPAAFRQALAMRAARAG